MSHFILDTSISTLYSHGCAAVAANLNAHSANHQISLTPVTVEEMLAGWYTQLRKARNAGELERAYDGIVRVWTSLSAIPMVRFPVSAILKYEQLNKFKLNIGGYDLRIAAIALVIGATVVTQNTRDFNRVPGLSVVDWSIEVKAGE